MLSNCTAVEEMLSSLFYSKLYFVIQEENAMKLRVQKPTDVKEAVTLASELALPCVSKCSVHLYQHNRYSCCHSTINQVVADSVSPNVEVKHWVDHTNADNSVKTVSYTQTKPVRQKDTRS